MTWRLHHRAETVSTNLDARAGKPGDVFTADFQTAGRGRLDHRWFSPPGTNLMMSVVLSVGGLSPETVATLPLVAGLAVVRAARRFLAGHAAPMLKWPNDVLVGGRKLAGILCERVGDAVIVGIGVNVGQTAFPNEIALRATSLALLGAAGGAPTVVAVREAVLGELDDLYARWRADGFAAVYPELATVDLLRGQRVSVFQTDADAAPTGGICDGIRADGSLGVAGQAVYAGEAHVADFCDFAP